MGVHCPLSGLICSTHLPPETIQVIHSLWTEEIESDPLPW
jgi:hypothetical protein